MYFIPISTVVNLLNISFYYLFRKVVIFVKIFLNKKIILSNIKLKIFLQL